MAAAAWPPTSRGTRSQPSGGPEPPTPSAGHAHVTMLADAPGVSRGAGGAPVLPAVAAGVVAFVAVDAAIERAPAVRGRCPVGAPGLSTIAARLRLAGTTPAGSTPLRARAVASPGGDVAAR